MACSGHIADRFFMLKILPGGLSANIREASFGTGNLITHADQIIA